jgi:hypothetical protein
LPLQVHIVGDFLSLFLYSFDPPNLGTMQQVSHPTNQVHIQCLGPMGNPDPTDLINAETYRISFRA